MSTLNKLVQDTRLLFSGMTPQARMLAVLLTIAIVVSVVFVANGVANSAAKTEYLFGGKSFNDSELERFSVAFSTAGLKDWERVGDRIKIPSNSKGEYYKSISNSMPGTLFSSMDDVMKSSNLLEPTRVIEYKQLNAKLKSIASTIKAMPTIQEAFVMTDESRLGFSSTRPKSASIAVMAKGGVPLSSEQKQSIMKFVQKSVAGLKPGDIALLDLASGQIKVGDDDPDIISQERFYSVKKQQEEDLKRRGLELLKDYGEVRLDVSVEIDPTLTEETSQMKFDPKSTTIQTSTTKKDEDSSKLYNQGRPGTEPNAISNRSASLTSRDQTSKLKESSENVKQVVGNTVTNIKKAGLQVRYASFAVSIPSSYYRRAYVVEQKEKDPNFDEKTTIPTEKELEALKQRVETSIKKILGALLQTSAPGEDKFPRVTVDEYIDFPADEIPEPSLAQTVLFWLHDSWKTLLLSAIALVAIISMRGFVASGTRSNDEDFERGFGLPIDDAADIDLTGLAGDDGVEGPEEEGTEGANSPPRFKTTGGDLKGDLTNMVRENPDAAATLLRNWISGASA